MFPLKSSIKLSKTKNFNLNFFQRIVEGTLLN